MKFKDEEHEQAYATLLKRMDSDEPDVYCLALAYLLTLDVVCREHLSDLYDFEDSCICPDAIGAEWQTGTSLKTTRLAFNLFNGGTAWTEEPERLAPAEIFCCDYAPYYWEAIEIRFHEYCFGNDL